MQGTYIFLCKMHSKGVNKDFKFYNFGILPSLSPTVINKMKLAKRF